MPAPNPEALGQFYDVTPAVPGSMERRVPPMACGDAGRLADAAHLLSQEDCDKTGSGLCAPGLPNPKRARQEDL